MSNYSDLAKRMLHKQAAQAIETYEAPGRDGNLTVVVDEPSSGDAPKRKAMKIVLPDADSQDDRAVAIGAEQATELRVLSQKRRSKQLHDALRTQSQSALNYGWAFGFMLGSWLRETPADRQPAADKRGRWHYENNPMGTIEEEEEEEAPQSPNPRLPPISPLSPASAFNMQISSPWADNPEPADERTSSYDLGITNPIGDTSPREGDCEADHPPLVSSEFASPTMKRIEDIMAANETLMANMQGIRPSTTRATPPTTARPPRDSAHQAHEEGEQWSLAHTQIDGTMRTVPAAGVTTAAPLSVFRFLPKEAVAGDAGDVEVEAARGWSAANKGSPPKPLGELEDREMTRDDGWEHMAIGTGRSSVVRVVPPSDSGQTQDASEEGESELATSTHSSGSTPIVYIEDVLASIKRNGTIMAEPSPVSSPASTVPMVMGLCEMLLAGRKRPDFIGEETEEERVINEARKYWAGSCLVFMLMMVSVLPVCIGLAMTLWYPELLRNQTWEEGLCLLQTLDMAVGAGPTCTVSAIVRTSNATKSVKAQEARCYADWGCRLDAGSQCWIPCWRSPLSELSIALENENDFSPSSLFIMAFVGPMATMLWITIWTWMESRRPNKSVDEQKPSRRSYLNCCTGSYTGVLWSLLVLAAMYYGMGLVGMMVVATNVTGDFRECRSDVVVWPLVTVMVAMATLLVVYAIIPLAAPYQYRLLYEYAVLPRLLQGVVVGVSCIAVAIAGLAEEAYGCDNHALYVAEWSYALACMYFGGLAGSVFLCCCPLVGFALPLPDYNMITESAVTIPPSALCPWVRLRDYRPLVVAAVSGASVIALGLLAYLTH